MLYGDLHRIPPYSLAPTDVIPKWFVNTTFGNTSNRKIIFTENKNDRSIRCMY